MRHILIINRYDDEFSDYRKYIDHTQVNVSYITMEDRSSLIDPEVSSFVVKISILDTDIVMHEARKIHQQNPIDSVIAFSEYDLDSAAEVRTQLNINGAKTSDNQLCRNKASMKGALKGSTVRYPCYQEISFRVDIESFCSDKGYPAILKPQAGAASEGVIKIECPEDIPELENFSGYEIEEYIDGDIYHVDAILTNDSIPYFKVSKYINTCLDFRHGKPLGSVAIDEPDLITTARALTQEVCKRLNLKSQAIHLEFIESNGKLVFVEVGGRVGGGEIPFVTKRCEGIDLYELWVQAALGVPISPMKTQITGFLMMPNPFSGDYVFDFDMELSHPLMTYCNLSDKGENCGFSYEDIPAKVHFMGDSQEAVTNAIIQCTDILQKSICIA